MCVTTISFRVFTALDDTEIPQMLVRNPDYRWSAQNLRDHEYFKQLDWEVVEAKDYEGARSRSQHIDSPAQAKRHHSGNTPSSAGGRRKKKHDVL